MLAAALAKVPDVYGPEALRDPFRGLHLSPEDVGRLLGQAPGLPTLHAIIGAGRKRQAARVRRTAGMACGLLWPVFL